MHAEETKVIETINTKRIHTKLAKTQSQKLSKRHLPRAPNCLVLERATVDYFKCRATIRVANIPMIPNYNLRSVEVDEATKAATKSKYELPNKNRNHQKGMGKPMTNSDIWKGFEGSGSTFGAKKFEGRKAGEKAKK